MRTGTPATRLIGLILVALVLVASIAMAALAWDQSRDDARIEDERAAQAAREALRESVGRVLTSLGAADGLVTDRGGVDTSSFVAFARAVQSIRSTDALALAVVVPAEGRAAFEDAAKHSITDLVRPGTFVPAGKRPRYVAISAVWPDTGESRALRGFDLTSEQVRRNAELRAHATRQTALTSLVPFGLGDDGFLALKPLYPREDAADPVAYVVAWFSTTVIRGVLEGLAPDHRVSLSVDGAKLYETESPPDEGVARSLSLGGRVWTVTARAGEPSRETAYAILAGGLVLALMLGAFAVSRESSERRLLRANDAEREAHERSKLLERHAANLVAPATARDVAAVTVSDLSDAGVEIVAVQLVHGDRVETLAATGIAPEAGGGPNRFLLDPSTPGGEAMRSGEIVEVATGEEYDERFPQTAAIRELQRIHSVIAVPLLDTDGTVLGGVVAASRRPGWLVPRMRPVVTGIAEQSGVALERARLRSVDDEARRRADILQRLVAALSAAALPTEVAEAAVPYLFEAFGASLATVGVAAGGDVRTLKVPARATADDWEWRPVPISTSTPTADAMRAKRVIELHGRERIRELYPPDVEQLLQGIVSMLVIPLPRQTGAVGVAFAESRNFDYGERAMLDAIAEELTQALERSALLERERDARLHAELMERNASRLAAATTVSDVASATVAEFQALGANVVFVWELGAASQLELLDASEVPDETRERFGVYPLELGGLVSEAMATGRLAMVASAEEFDARYPELSHERERVGVESLAAVPLRAASGQTVGAIFAAANRKHWLDHDRSLLLLGVAEQTGVALERARLFETEREARRLAELLERNAAHLAAAMTVRDIASSTVADLEAAGIGRAILHVRGGDGMDLIAAATMSQEELERLSPAPIDGDTLVAETLRRGVTIDVASGDEHDARFPGSASLRRRLAVEAILSVPLRAADRRVIGVLAVGSADSQPWSESTRQVIFGVAEQCGLALDRAELQAEAEQASSAHSFLAVLGESLERATTAKERARRLVELLIEEHATFAAIHLVDADGPPELVVSGGSRPAQLDSDDRWADCVEKAISTGREVSPDGGRTEADPAGASPTLLVLPLRARGHGLGAITVRIARGPHWKPMIAPALAREVAARAAVALDNALLYEREREVSHTLQLGLLGGALPIFDGVVVSAAYRAGTAALEVGGDWYDAFRLESGRIALVVGDVVGHGLEAAVAMGQLRGAVSALAQTAPPALLLERLDAFVETVPSAATATLAYVELDPETGYMRYACAGHPPPLIVSPQGPTRYLWEGRSAPLGSMLGDARSQAETQLAEGETLLLYTDGVVERRGESIDAGLERLAHAVRLAAFGNSSLADDISDQLLEGHEQDDDVCVLTVHRTPTGGMFSHSFTASPSELARLRERLRGWLDQNDVDDEVERGVVLAVSEAAANAVEHAYDCDGAGIVTVMARIDGERLDIAVRDEGTWSEDHGQADRGRGLSIMRAIVDELSVGRENGATVLRMSRAVREGAASA